MTAFLVPLLNAVLLPIVFRNLGRVALSRPRLVTALLAAVVYLDACYLFWSDYGFPSLFALLAAVVAGAMTLPDSYVEPLTRALGPVRLPLFLASVLTVGALVYVYLPITTFLTSPGELDLHLEFLLTHNAQRTLALVYGAAAVYGVAMFSRMRSVLSLGAYAILLTTLVYAFVLPFGYPMMNGLMFEQVTLGAGVVALRAAGDVLLIPVIVLAAVATVVRFGGRSALVSVGLLHLSLLLASGIGALRNVGAGQEGEVTVTDDRPLRFTKTGHNALLLFVDRFMGGFVEDILARDPTLAQRLGGFTWYPRTMSAGLNSIAGLHPLLGGYDYTPDQMNKRGMLLRDLSVESFAILPWNFTSKGWRASLVNPHGLGFTMEGDCSFLDIPGLTCTQIPLTVTTRAAAEVGMPMAELSRADYAELLVLLGTMRAAPYLGKATVGERGPWREFLDHSAGTTFRQWAELRGLPELSRTDATQDSLNVVLNMLPHEPYFLGEDCMPRQTQLSLADSEVAARGYKSLFELQHAIAARCTLGLVADYMDWLRAEGVYDNTRIVLVSDHGIVGPVSDRSSRATAGGTDREFFVQTRSFLAVKARDATGPLAVSEDFMPNAEVPRILCEEIGGCVNPYLDNRPITAQGRDDPFMVTIVPWQFNAQYPDAFRIESQFAVLGKDPYKADNWREVVAR